jgi:DNA (cytosine-5)-methyltransferase 1
VRPKSGLPKRKALRRMPKFEFGFRENPDTAPYRHPSLIRGAKVPDGWPTVLSFFSGCGGMDLGFLGGFKFLGHLYDPLPLQILHAYDNSPNAVRTYRLNISDEVSVIDLSSADLEAFPRADILIGGFPCQDFSSCGLKLGLNGPRGELYTVMRDYMKIHQPKVVVGENVPHLERMQGGQVLRKIQSELEEVGYRFKLWRMCCPDYGLPQSRTRLFFVGVRNDLRGFPEMPTITHILGRVSIDDAIHDLETVEDESIPNQSQYFVATKATAGAGQGDQKSEVGQLAYTVRANSKARVQFHYSLDRRLTVRESARLQSFPDQFVFPHASSANMIEIGNAVPPIIAHHVAKSISDYLLRDLSKLGAERIQSYSGRVVAQ